MMAESVSHLLESLGEAPWDEANVEDVGVALQAQASQANESDWPHLAQALHASRERHESRREWHAALCLVEAELRGPGAADSKVELCKHAGVVCRDHAFDDEAAQTWFERATSLNPGDADAAECLDGLAETASKWKEILSRFLEEAETAADQTLQSSLLTSARGLGVEI